MGMRPDDFGDLTPAEFFYAYAGWATQQRARQKQQWEQLRWQTWVLTCIQLEKKDRREMTEMFPLPWEMSQDAKPLDTRTSAELTDEERQERVNELLQCVKHKE